MDFRESGFMAPVRLWILPLSMPGDTAPNGFSVVSQQSAPGTKNAARACVLKENAKFGFAALVVFFTILELKCGFEGYA